MAAEHAVLRASALPLQTPAHTPSTAVALGDWDDDGVVSRSRTVLVWTLCHSAGNSVPLDSICTMTVNYYYYY